MQVKGISTFHKEPHWGGMEGCGGTAQTIPHILNPVTRQG